MQVGDKNYKMMQIAYEYAEKIIDLLTELIANRTADHQDSICKALAFVMGFALTSLGSTSGVAYGQSDLVENAKWLHRRTVGSYKRSTSVDRLTVHDSSGPRDFGMQKPAPPSPDRVAMVNPKVDSDKALSREVYNRARGEVYNRARGEAIV